MEKGSSLSLLLLLLLGLTQAHPLSNNEIGEDVIEEAREEDFVDISTRILVANNGSDEMLLEGDLVLPKTRNAMVCFSSNCLWSKASDGLVYVPYTMSGAFSNSDQQTIGYAMGSFASSTCIRFVARTNQRDFIDIQNYDGCYSSLGRTGGSQTLSLNRQGCMYAGVAMHELNHALGFQHEQTRSDRDRYVVISWENIDPQNAYNFNLANTNNLNTPYDYSSVMHYGSTAFSINGRDTITPIPNRNVEIGQRRGLSPIDIQRIKRLYNC
ncbi:high choriolytic enzyme 1-like [Aplochiton taeniatus]